MAQEACDHDPSGQWTCFCIKPEVLTSALCGPGDYNTSADRHLGAARVDRLHPDVLISESTYATTLRDGRRARERDFLQAVHEAVSRGGKVLVPVFAVGRAQELLLMVEEFWERMGIKVGVGRWSLMKPTLSYTPLSQRTSKR